jgi:hypothetical protein
MPKMNWATFWANFSQTHLVAIIINLEAVWLFSCCKIRYVIACCLDSTICSGPNEKIMTVHFGDKMATWLFGYCYIKIHKFITFCIICHMKGDEKVCEKKSAKM